MIGIQHSEGDIRLYLDRSRLSGLEDQIDIHTWSSQKKTREKLRCVFDANQENSIFDARKNTIILNDRMLQKLQEGGVYTESIIEGTDNRCTLIVPDRIQDLQDQETRLLFELYLQFIQDKFLLAELQKDR